jgi:hypothetical protein
VESGQRRWLARVEERCQIPSQPNTKGPIRSETQYSVTSWTEIP